MRDRSKLLNRKREFPDEEEEEIKRKAQIEEIYFIDGAAGAGGDKWDYAHVISREKASEMIRDRKIEMGMQITGESGVESLLIEFDEFDALYIPTSILRINML